MSRHIVVDGETHPVTPERLYCITNKKGVETFAWSPDGEGFYWYDSEEEADDAHGEVGSIIHIDAITDF